MYEYDCRIVVTTPIQADNLRGKDIWKCIAKET
jgi:hypothetical protein